MAQDDDEKARKERAARLRKKVDQLIKGGKATKPGEEGTPPKSPRPKSPREFVDEKMREEECEEKKDAP